MNYLNQLFEQARSLVMTMTPASRLMAGLMLAVILIGSAFLVRDAGSNNMEYLYGGHTFKQSELQLAETALGNAGLREYECVGMRIRVPRAERDVYIKALAVGGATPQQLGSATDKAMSGGNVLESMLLTKTRLLEARKQDLATALERLPFVDKVFITYDEKREGFATQAQSTAGVLVIPRNQQPLSEDQMQSIRRQVQSAFAGLKYEHISVMDGLSGRSLHGDNDPASSEQQRYYHHKKLVEERLREKARNLLADYGDVKVEATVELDPTLRQESQSLKYDERPITIQTTLSKKDTESIGQGSGGRPGTDPNATGTSNRPQSLSSSGGTSNKSKEQQQSERSIVGKETTLSEKIGLMEKSASFSVAIPFSYYNIAWRREWQEMNPGKAVTDAPAMTQTEFKTFKEDIHKKVQASLASLLPEPPAGIDARPRVTVSDYIDMPTVPLEAPSIASTGLLWLSDNWQNLGMFLLAGMALMALRSFVASSSSRSDDAFERGFDLKLDETVDGELASVQTASAEILDESIAVEGESADGSSKSPRFPTTGSEIRSELSNLIREKPDMAATLLRSWIGGDAA
jgi:flagellar M-ring protein FliF